MITVVALQLASSQLTPRVLRGFMGDRGNQAVLGLFIGTFTYALLVLRSVRSPLEGEGGFVPAVSVTVAIVLALISVGFLIFYVHHAANSIRASVVVDRVARGILDLIDRLFPADVGRAAEPGPLIGEPALPARAVLAGRGGYLQSINGDHLFDLAVDRSLTVRAEPRVGEFVLPGAVLASV